MCSGGLSTRASARQLGPLWVKRSPAGRLISTAEVPQIGDGIAAVTRTVQKRMFDNPHVQTLDSDDMHGIVRTPHDVAWDNRNEQRTDDSLRYHDRAPFLTRADLKPGDLIAAGYSSNYGARKQASWVYLTGTLDAAIWGAELATGDGRARIYIVEPTGPIVGPNLTDKKFPGNPTSPIVPRAAQGHGRGHGVARPLSRAAEGDEGSSRTAEGARHRGDRLIFR